MAPPPGNSFFSVRLCTTLLAQQVLPCILAVISLKYTFQTTIRSIACLMLTRNNELSQPTATYATFPTDCYISCPAIAMATQVACGHPRPGPAALVIYLYYSRIRETRRVHTQCPHETIATLDTRHATVD